jgi:Fic-DOC domain mobile mystery protein B
MESINNFQNQPEGATPIDSDDLDGLIPRFITTRQELNDAEFKNIQEADTKYYSQKRLALTLSFIYKVHEDMFKRVWKWAGKKRITNKNIGTDKTQIDSDLKNLIDDIKFRLDKKHDPQELAVQLHHRLVKIHPFNNGNGRWARFITDLFLLQHLGSYISWPEDTLYVSTTLRAEYIQALQRADQGDYTKLTDLHQKYLKPM